MLTSEQKLEWCRRARDAGLKKSKSRRSCRRRWFRNLPMRATSRAALSRSGDFVASALVPELKGAQRAIEAGLRKVQLCVVGSEAHNQANVRRSTSVVDNFKDIIDYRNGLRSMWRDGWLIAGASPPLSVHDLRSRGRNTGFCRLPRNIWRWALTS